MSLTLPAPGRRTPTPPPSSPASARPALRWVPARLATTLLATTVSLVGLGVAAPEAGAATTYTTTRATASVSGSTVTFATTVRASTRTTASSFGFCVANTAGAGFRVTPARPFTLSTAGSGYSASRTLPAGSYRWWPCGTVNGARVRFGPQKTLTVRPSTPSSTSAPRGNLPGFTQVLAEDFRTSATPAQLGSRYAGVFAAYQDNAVYRRSNLSVHDGVFDFTLTGTNGGAGVFGPPGKAWGTRYGKFSVRFKAVGADGNGTAMILWPSSDVWGEGEIDFPEGDFDSTINGFHHPMGCRDCAAFDWVSTNGATWRSWHVASVEWTPTRVRYFLDGRLLSTITHNIPKTNHRFTVQTAANRPGAAKGHLLIDWVAQYTMS